MNTTTAYSHRAGPSYSAYVTFVDDEDAAKCIKALDGFVIYNRDLSATFGTTKYCSYFLKGAKCHKGECLYLHKLGLSEDILDRKEGKQVERAKAQVLESYNIEIDPPGTMKVVFPSVRLLRARNMSADVFNLPVRTERRLSLITPDRTTSRFWFVQADSKERPGEVPDHITQIVTANSQLDHTMEIQAKHITMLLAPNGPDSWIGELIGEKVQEVVRRLSMDDTGLVKAKSVL